jgi:hypothetical protein
VLALLFAALLVIALAQSAIQQGQPLPTPVVSLRPVFDTFAIDDIFAIRLRDLETQQTYTIARGETAWVFPDAEQTDTAESGTPAPADQNTAHTIARTIMLMPYEATQPLLSQAALAEFGLDAPRLSIEIVLASGETHGVLVGSLNTAATAYYALIDDREPIYQLTRPAIDYLMVIVQNRSIA